MFRELNKKAADLCCGAPILHELVEWAKDTLLPSYAIVRKKDKTDEPKKSKREPKKSKPSLRLSAQLLRRQSVFVWPKNAWRRDAGRYERKRKKNKRKKWLAWKL